MSAVEEIVAERRREHRREIEERAIQATVLRARLPVVVRQATLAVLDEADDLEEVREIVEGSA